MNVNRYEVTTTAGGPVEVRADNFELNENGALVFYNETDDLERVGVRAFAPEIWTEVKLQ